VRYCAPTSGVPWNRETSKLCFYTILPGVNVTYPYKLRLSDKSSRFMKLTFGKFDRKLKKQPDQDRPFALSSEQENAGSLSLPTHRTLRISFRSSRSSHLESSKGRRSINVGMTPCLRNWIMSFGYSVLMSKQRPPRRSGHLGPRQGLITKLATQQHI
jgi:hypothetical protein